MVRYKLTEDGCHDQEEDIFIPGDMANRHWRKYQEWLGEGNAAEPMDVPVDPTEDQILSLTDQAAVRLIDWLIDELDQNGIININNAPAHLKSLYRERETIRDNFKGQGIISSLFAKINSALGRN